MPRDEVARSLGLLTLVLGIVLAALLPSMLRADAPPLPCRVYGELPESQPGTVVSARVGGVEYATSISFTDAGRAVFVVDVPGDDPSTPEVEGATDGAALTFQLDGVDTTQGSVWSPGQAVLADLQPIAQPGGPVANDLSIDSLEDVPVALVLTATDPDGQPLTYAVVSPPSQGTLEGVAPVLTYVPNANWNGVDSFTFEASDGTATDLGVVTLTVDPVPDPPVLAPIPDTVIMAGTSLEVPVVATDADGHVITLTGEGLPAFAQLVETGNGVASLTLNPGFGDVGVYGAPRIVASDGSLSDSELFLLEVILATGPPVATDLAVSTPEDTAVPVALEAVDPDGDPIDFAVATGPEHGVLSGTAPALVYTPDADFSGSDSFTYTAAASDGVSAPATVTVTVDPVADAPRLDPLNDLVLAEGAEVTVPVVAVEVDGEPVTLSVTGLPVFAAFVDFGSGVGEIVLVPGFADAGVYPGIEVTASDGTLDATDTFDVTVEAFEAPPVAAFRPADGLSVAALGSATVEASSGHLGSATPERAIDGYSNTQWRTDANGPHWMRVRLLGDREHVIDRVVLRGRGTNSGARNFEIRVSTTGAEEADFTTVLAAELPQDNLDHTFSLPPVSARLVEMRTLDNWGNTVATDVYTFEVHTRARQGGVVSLLGGGAFVADVSSAAQPAANAFDFSDFTRWQSVNGQGTDQWVTIDLIGDTPWLIDRARIVGPSNNSSPRDFEVRVSSTGLDPLDFTTVHQGTVPEGGTPHWALFEPVEARYVQLFVHDTYGLSFVSVGSFDVVSPEVGGPQVGLDDQSFDADGSVTAWAWDFGDGATSVERHPEHTFATPGTYTLALTVTDNQGQTTQASREYTVLPSPVADFTWTPQPTVTEGDAVRFADLSTSPNGPVEGWRWIFHEGSERTADDPLWVYQDEGSYPVTLEVTDPRGLVGTTTIPVVVVNAPPSINLIPGPSTVWGVDWELGQASVVDPGGDDQGSLTCTWDFGDGETLEITGCYGTAARIEHTYALPGTYTATLTASDPDGGTVQESLQHEVLLRPSRVTLLDEQEILATDVVELTARLIDDFAGDSFVGGDLAPDVPLAGRTLTFRRGAETVDVVTDANGEASVSLPSIPGGGDPVVVEFAGDALYLPDSGQQLPPGSVLAGIGEGNVHVYTPEGVLVEVLETGSGSLEQTGMCLDPMGILYTTNFNTLQQPLSQSYGSTSRLDRWGNQLDVLWTGPYSPNPESCVLDPAGNMLVGLVDGGPGEPLLYRYAPDGSLLDAWLPEEEHRGVDWIDLAEDGCTLYYTSEGTRVLRFDVCTGQQLPDFATGLESPTFALRIRPNGEVLVASSDLIYRLDPQGQVMQTYFDTSGSFFALNLDPDGTSFWTAYYGSGTIFRVDIETGDVLTTFTAGPLPFALSGLAIVGEPTAANNHAPNAHAGDDVLSTVGATVGLDGSSSSDPDVGDVLSFVWTQIAGPVAVLDDPTSPTPTFTAVEEGTYGFELTVNDGARSDTDTVQVVVEAAPAGCALAPFTLDWSVLGGVGIGQAPVEVSRGVTSGHFGWLSWSGAEDVATLATSLSLPGDSHTWQHPSDPSDTVISPGDWVFALGDQPDDAQLQTALDTLIGQDVIVPIWDYHYQGPDYQKFRVAAFVHLRLASYQLDGEDRLSIQYFGEAQCPSP